MKQCSIFQSLSALNYYWDRVNASCFWLRSYILERQNLLALPFPDKLDTGAEHSVCIRILCSSIGFLFAHENPEWLQGLERFQQTLKAVSVRNTICLVKYLW